ncbi:MAG TPA: hydantoinase/oxoprolinase family protein [Pyrinomonadaceae bacterium]|nr:hydantoinase/oxoprolinase family protein [Pyrinomonadaceae bacterium]
MIRDKKQKAGRVVRVGVDTGGTFTDFVYGAGGGGLRVFKLASTPADPSVAIAEGLRRVAEETGARAEDLEVVHGTTVGTNALLERRGARAALVTTEGFEDVLEIGRQARPRLYDFDAEAPRPLVARELRFGVRERVAASGEVLEELDDDELTRLVRKLRRARVESVAVSLLFSFVRPEHERRVTGALASLNVPVSASHRILPEYREYERTSTAAVNAYLQPLMGAYLGRLNERAPGLRVMQSSGGSVSARVAADEPVRTILTGPAGGVVGALESARAAGFADIITFDMGGTSTDVALCAGGRVRLTNEAAVASLPVAVPVMDIHTVGAGGGSVARVDEGGSLRVGPESAGADPGPACYGRGTKPTVTDANLVLNRFGGTDLLGGDFKLDDARAEKVLAELAREMSRAGGRKVDARSAALGVVRVVNAGMERALRAVSVERGFDPRAFTLLTFGGAGGLHAVELARALRVPRVVVPRAPGALSALGALRSDVVKDQSRTVMLGSDEAGARDALSRAFREMEREGADTLRREGFAPVRQRHERSVNARYKGQSFELEIKWPYDDPRATRDARRNARQTSDKNRAPKSLDRLAALFHEAHLARYGYARESGAVEVVSARGRSVGLVERLAAEELPRARAARAEPHARAEVYLTDGRRRVVAVYRRDGLPPGARLESPCVVTEYSSTTLVPEGARASLDALGNLIIEP